MKNKFRTFANLFTESIYSKNGETIEIKDICIPIIQRDYAQGRQNQKVNRIRTNFLNSLYDNLSQDKEIVLDFVYGNVDNKGVLNLLDGQQRLTTLFLLHWIAAKKEDIADDNYIFLKHFSYQTRFSSRDFCEKLIDFSPEFNTNIKLSEQIIDTAWFQYDWNNDPTIQSMLVMLDALNDKFKDLNDIWNKLTEKELIKFSFLSLDNLGMTDDLYIKMNSRGKALTEFEHFKAEFEKRLKNIDKTLAQEFSHKFDIDWADMLFPYRGENNIIDDEFMRYFFYISHIMCYKENILISDEGKLREEDEFSLLDNLYFSDTSKTIERLNYLKDTFDCWINTNFQSFFEQFLSKHSYISNHVKIYDDDVNLLKQCLDDYGIRQARQRKFPLNKMLLLYAFLVYKLNETNINAEDFARRIRIVRNLIENSQYEVREERMPILLKEIDNIILKAEIPVSKIEKNELGFKRLQKQEEVDKLEWTVTNPNLADELFHLEDHHLLKGCIAVVGLNNYENFSKFRKLFNDCNKNLIYKALLTFGDFSRKENNWRYLLGGKNDSSWTDLFQPTTKDDNFKETSAVLNRFLAQTNIEDLNDDYLEKIITNYINDVNTKKDWRYYIVKYFDSMTTDYGKYYWKNKEEYPYELIMMNTATSLNGKNWNIFASAVYDNMMDKVDLGNYAYNYGDCLYIKDKEIYIDIKNASFILFRKNENNKRTDIKTVKIEQKDGIDTQDRVESLMDFINHYNKYE